MSSTYNHHQHKFLQFSYTCHGCGKTVDYLTAKSGCSNCPSSLFKVSRRGTGWPEAFTFDKKDPYKTEYTPGDGQGFDGPLMTPGDEDTQGGMGTRFRGEHAPRNFQSNDEYEKQRKKDIPYSDHMFVGQPKPQIGEGVNDGTFYDPDSPLSTERMVSDELNPNIPTPVGPHNMHKYKNVFDKTRRSQKGV